MTKLGFIGLGVMGRPMSINLAKKYPTVLCYDNNVDRNLVGGHEGRVIAPTIQHIGLLCEVVFLSLPSTSEVRTVVEELAQYLKPGSIIVNTSTCEASAEVEISGRLFERGINYLDAPVSGGEKGAIGGSLIFMVGGEGDVFRRVLPYFQTMGLSAVHLGGAGAGQIAKCVNQVIVGVTFAAIAEAFALGVKAGLDTQTLYQAIKDGWAGSKLLDVAAADMISGEYKPGGTINLLHKDLNYVMKLADQHNFILLMAHMTDELFQVAIDQGDGGKSQAAIVRLWERACGVKV